MQLEEMGEQARVPMGLSTNWDTEAGLTCRDADYWSGGNDLGQVLGGLTFFFLLFLGTR